MKAEVRAQSQQTHTAHDNTGRQTGDVQTDSTHQGRTEFTGQEVVETMPLPTKMKSQMRS